MGSAALARGDDVAAGPDLPADAPCAAGARAAISAPERTNAKNAAAARRDFLTVNDINVITKAPQSQPFRDVFEGRPLWMVPIFGPCD